MEHRIEGRRRTLRKGLIVLNANASVIECLVKNISPGGAGLWMHGWMVLPERFELRIPGEDLRADVRLAWQRGQEVGVEFVEAATIRSAVRATAASRSAAA
jgi:hypothetical protein